jgi:hypothetical protein
MNTIKRTKCEEKKYDADHYANDGVLTRELNEFIQKNTHRNQPLAGDRRLRTFVPSSTAELGAIRYLVNGSEEILSPKHHRRCVAVEISAIDNDYTEFKRAPFEMVIAELKGIIESNPNFRVVRSSAVDYAPFARLWVGCPVQVPDLASLCVLTASRCLDAERSYHQLPGDLQDRYFRVQVNSWYKWIVKE